MNRRVCPFLIAVFGCIALPASGQCAQSTERMAADAHPAFAVATIKPHDPK